MNGPLWSAEDLLRRLGDPHLVLVDCRFDLMKPEVGRLAFQAGHIPGARYADLNQDLSGPVRPGVTGRHPLPDLTQLASTFGGWGISSESMVVAYDDSSGAFAARLWWLLRYLGHQHAVVLDGGLSAWTAVGGPIETAVSLREPATFVPRVQPELLVGVADVQAAVATSAPLLDARATPRFRGDEEPIDRVPGHIPGARSLPFMTLLDGGRFAPPERVREAFEQALLGTPSSSAICYCGSGVTACHLLLGAVHAGLPMPRLYAGSYSEWITDPARAVERGDG